VEPTRIFFMGSRRVTTFCRFLPGVKEHANANIVAIVNTANVEPRKSSRESRVAFTRIIYIYIYIYIYIIDILEYIDTV
jgi:hypothetical protein